MLKPTEQSIIILGQVPESVRFAKDVIKDFGARKNMEKIQEQAREVISSYFDSILEKTSTT